jgi:aerotaxis receptor
MSTTDTQSHIQYANDAFIAVSGYSREELQGQPHNLVRHPDMPEQAFADMWATLKGGEPWTALVKNRRKNGDHYWVRANAVPVVRDGKISGYLSVRTAPARAEVEAAEQLYANFREGRANHLAFHKGMVLRTGVGAWRSILRTLPVRWRALAAPALVTLTSLAAAAAVGVPAQGLAAFAVALGASTAAAAWWLEVQVTRPLERLRDQALDVTTGARREAAPTDRIDDIGMTTRCLGQVGLMLRWLVDDVSSQVITVQTATTEIAQGNGDLSSRTEQAAASVEQTASSMEQMTASVKSNADTAALANQLSGSASAAAAQGGQAVGAVVETMTEITHSSKKIADIIGVIDSIAFQTNILALNAAVEAARAGEQGRGFAVVAGEVRHLAQRSADAAKEIKTLIGASVERVERGTALVDRAGQTMQQIVESIRRVSDLIAEISSATSQQTSGITQVGEAIGHLDQITQQNAALVEQSAAASESLNQQARRLVEAVSVIR